MADIRLGYLARVLAINERGKSYVPRDAQLMRIGAVPDSVPASGSVGAFADRYPRVRRALDRPRERASRRISKQVSNSVYVPGVPVVVSR